MKPWPFDGRRTVAAVLAVLPWLAACTESPLEPADPDDAPGPTVETREVRLDVASLPAWRDTSLAGFALPGDGGFLFLATEDALRARVLARFSAIPDSVAVSGDSIFAPVDSLTDGSVLVRIDTTASTLPAFPFTLRLHGLARPFDDLAVDWERAAEGEPWTSPGGDLGPLLASATVEAATDTVPLALAVSTDSLLGAWREAEGEPGVALLVGDAGARLRITALTLRFDAFAEGLASPSRTVLAPRLASFIYDPPAPGAGSRLRLGGLPSWRSYLTLRLPESLGGIPLEDATVSHAEIVLHPLAPASDPFLPTAAIAAQGFRLLGDPFVFGQKTPVGPSASGLLTLDPDSLAAGEPLRVDVTGPVRLRLEDDEGPGGPILLGLRASPDAQGLGFWDFASVEHPDPALRPELVLIVSSPPPFQVP